jgi:hypothetical protein
MKIVCTLTFSKSDSFRNDPESALFNCLAFDVEVGGADMERSMNCPSELLFSSLTGVVEGSKYLGFQGLFCIIFGMRSFHPIQWKLVSTPTIWRPNDRTNARRQLRFASNCHNQQPLTSQLLTKFSPLFLGWSYLEFYWAINVLLERQEIRQGPQRQWGYIVWPMGSEIGLGYFHVKEACLSAFVDACGSVCCCCDLTALRICRGFQSTYLAQRGMLL